MTRTQVPFRLCSLVVASIVAAACDSSTPSSPSPLQQRITITQGQSLVVPSTTLSVAFDRVTDDSRCPADALCIDAGQATAVFFIAERGDAPSRHALRTPGNPGIAVVGAYRIAFEDLQPYPFSSRPTNPADYRATLVVVRD